MMKHALAAGADVNVKMDDGLTALILAARDGRGGMAKFLIAEGADVNGRNDQPICNQFGCGVVVYCPVEFILYGGKKLLC
mgnify:CR=1 FL=1